MEIAELYARYFEILCSSCTKMTREPEEAEELVQEAFLKALTDKNFQTLAPPQQRAWLLRTARRLFIDKARRRAREPLQEKPPENEPDLFALPVAENLSRLSPELQQLVTLRYFVGYSSFELGQHLGLSPATVRTRLRAAAKILREYYQ